MTQMRWGERRSDRVVNNLPIMTEPSHTETIKKSGEMCSEAEYDSKEVRTKT